MASSHDCTCGYPAENEADLDEHIIQMARAGSEEGEHRPVRVRT